MSSLITLIKVLSISTSLIASGGILSLSLFDIPLLKSQPATRSLPQIRWLFSRGSHIFPTAAILSSTGFIYLSITSLSPSESFLDVISNIAGNSPTVNGYLLAGVLSAAIGPFTQFAMIPTNFELIERNEELGGARSEESAKKAEGKGKVGGKTARESVDGERDLNQFGDLSGPQEKTEREGNEEDDRAVEELLERFKWLNLVRSVLIGCGGVVGLLTAIV
ncbi:hypothetical protein ONS95_002804 [Cadophora gregata]|uniref:uncharacterized protein n=1 Tax=Cadophora gregata TaxID=51156 RepID=UPI0026DDB70F|nr:uncharacterized protein ONS95_002804 [Cadophora gregata]KAK0110152.1 hypothetical protein ONS95_002804 [Cadophora gregata]KAK0110233.1 hypothetical protein ONS96_001855 [Cadophora gregata f. sp. sojae]